MLHARRGPISTAPGRETGREEGGRASTASDVRGDASFVAVLGLAGIAGYILSNQRFYPPAWVPLDRHRTSYELRGRAVHAPRRSCRARARRSTSPGVKVGEIGQRAHSKTDVPCVNMKIQRKYAPALQGRHDPAAAQDGAQGHVPGARSRQRSAPASSKTDGTHHRSANTRAGREPRRDPRPSSTCDTRDYLRVLLSAGPRAWRATRPPSCARRSSASSPPPATCGRSPRKLAQRRRKNVAPGDPQLLSSWRQQLGSKDRAAGRAACDSSNANFEAFANQEASGCARSLQLLPGDARPAPRRTLTSVDELSARQLGPALSKLRPGAPGPSGRRCAPSRPFLPLHHPGHRATRSGRSRRDVRPTIRDLRRGGPRPCGGRTAA